MSVCCSLFTSGVFVSCCRYFCVASKQPLPVPVPGLQQPCLCTPSLLLQLQRQGAEATQLLRAAQQHLVSLGFLLFGSAVWFCCLIVSQVTGFW
jgi:hypothetical protein